MSKTRSAVPPKNCPSCGAPVTSEICAYCGTATGIHSAAADMEYPVLECKEAALTFWTTWFPMIFAAAFGIPGLIVMCIAASGFGGGIMLLTGLPFLLIGIAALCLTLRTVSRYIKVKKYGKQIQATVYGYMDDSVLINDQPAQIVKLLVQTPDGPRFLLYQLGDTKKPYGIHETIEVMVYQNCFMICKNQEIVQW